MPRAATRKTSGRNDTRRRFEQWAKNPRCESNTVSAVFGVPMGSAARMEAKEKGQPLVAEMGQSPFAITRGQQFEKLLFANEAERARKALVRAGVLPARSSGFSDLRLSMNGGSSPDLDTALERTRELLGRLAKRRGSLPSLVAGATVSVPGAAMLPEAILVLDVLVAPPGLERPRLIVGEIKTYPDRGGYTDATELATARAQAGVYVHGLRVVLEELGLGERIDVADDGILILTRPGSNLPSVRAGEDLRYQARRAERGFAQLRHVSTRVPAPTSEAKGVPVVLAAPTSYTSSCLAFCERAQSCFQAAVESGDPIILGEGVKRYLGDISLPRAIELMGGKRPKGEAEKAFLEDYKVFKRGAP